MLPRRGVLSLLVLTAACAWLLGSSPQTRPEGPGTGKTRAPVEEEVDPLGKKIKNIDLDAPERAEASGEDLAEAAARARDPRVRDLFKRLAVPYDLLTLNTDKNKPVRIQPLPFLTTDKVKIPDGQKVVPLDDAGKPGAPIPLVPGQVDGIEPYEQLAQAEVKKFLDQKGSESSRIDQLKAAETVLASVSRYHQSAHQRGRRQERDFVFGDGNLREQLRDILLEQFQELVRTEEWDPALTLARRLYETYTEKKDLKKIVGPLVNLLKLTTDKPQVSRIKLRQVREKLRELAESDFNEIREQLQAMAEHLLRQARALEKTDKTASQDLLRQASEIWPQLPELRKELANALEKYPILRVGVRQVPRYLSPALACTDSEQRAVEMLFESLVRATPNAEGDYSYNPGLALGRPRVVPLGRQFYLPRNASWSDNQPLKPQDIRFTVREMAEGRPCTGLPRAWGQLLKEAYWAGDDPYRFEVILNQGYLEPLSLMTFKILPLRSGSGALAVDSEDFALHPISSGPFTYKGTDNVDGRKRVVFAANPNYGNRQGKTGLPRISEVHFIELKDPLTDFKEDRIDLALDLTADEAISLREHAAERKVTVPTPLPGNRRVYFLAINHRTAGLENADLRRAIAYAIDRENLLDTLFRKGLARKIHKALNSPYPAGSWALDPTLNGKGGKESLNFYSKGHARSFAESAFRALGKKKGIDKLSFTLSFPEGDEAILKAMEQIRASVEIHTGIQLELKPCDPYKLRQDIEHKDYQLAYTHYDFADNTFWLWPLLGTDNYLNYHDKEIDQEFLDMQGRRDFAVIQEATRRNHVRINRDMPVIPLWQLDPLMAISEDLKTPLFDPWLVFTEIDQWRLERKGR